MSNKKKIKAKKVNNPTKSSKKTNVWKARIRNAKDGLLQCHI